MKRIAFVVIALLIINIFRTAEAQNQPGYWTPRDEGHSQPANVSHFFHTQSEDGKTIYVWNYYENSQNVRPGPRFIGTAQAP